jgi:hypothetical protein
MGSTLAPWSTLDRREPYPDALWIHVVDAPVDEIEGRPLCLPCSIKLSVCGLCRHWDSLKLRQLGSRRMFGACVRNEPPWDYDTEMMQHCGEFAFGYPRLTKRQLHLLRSEGTEVIAKTKWWKQ